MRKLLTALAAAVAAVAILVTPAGAVQGGTPDGNGHPNVGLSVFLYHGIPLWRCSGTMVAAQVYLTAGHCTGIDTGLGIAPDRARCGSTRAGFRSARTRLTAIRARPRIRAIRAKASSPAHLCRTPGWNGSLTIPNTHDMGVIKLTAAPNKGLSKIAPLGYLDGLATQRGQRDITSP